MADAAQEAQSRAPRVLCLRGGRGAGPPHPVPITPAILAGVPYCRGSAFAGRVPPGEGTLQRALPRTSLSTRRGERVGVRGGNRDWRHDVVLCALSRALHERRGRAFAESQAWRGSRSVRRERLLQFREQRRPPRQPACDVVAHVHDRLRLRLDREHRVERRDAVGVRRGDGEALADVVEGAGRDPADARLGRPEGRAGEDRAARGRHGRRSRGGHRSPGGAPRRPSRWSGGPSPRRRPRVPRRWRGRRG